MAYKIKDGEKILGGEFIIKERRNDACVLENTVTGLLWFIYKHDRWIYSDMLYDACFGEEPEKIMIHGFDFTDAAPEQREFAKKFPPGVKVAWANEHNVSMVWFYWTWFDGHKFIGKTKMTDGHVIDNWFLCEYLSKWKLYQDPAPTWDWDAEEMWGKEAFKATPTREPKIFRLLKYAPFRYDIIQNIGYGWINGHATAEDIRQKLIPTTRPDNWRNYDIGPEEGK